jgi:ATP-dependent helicase/nuclease subunit A
MSGPRTIPDAVRTAQTLASDPSASAFVAANAGSGKTHVLAQRVIRLLLAGVDPGAILCITFTKAAAANMATRVFNTLANWVALDDAALDQAIGETGTKAVTPALRQRARRLFACALETPGGLKVQTIHAFCTRLLHQFPFEANVAARFTVLDARSEQELLDQATTAILLDAARDPDTPLGRALATAITAAADTTFRDVVREAIGERDAVSAWITSAGCVDAAMAQLSVELGIDAHDTLTTVETQIVDGPILPSSQWAALAAQCKESSANDQKQCERLNTAAAASGAARIDAYLAVFLTTELKPRKSIITAALGKRQAELPERLAQEQARLLALIERRKAILCRDRTAALMTISREAIVRYSTNKDRRGLLDYEDLIDKTLDMLGTVNPSWVHYKLDLGIDHVLIDEAQDTSPKQWEIVRRLVAEFAAGAGARAGVRRTVFAVGDEKQSIFSFQGAAPRKFDDMRRAFKNEFDLPELGFHDVRFHYSFRSGPNVLGAVDEVFRAPHIHLSVTTDPGGMPPHESLPSAAPGLVEIWPLVKPDERRDIEGWDAPFDQLSETSPQVRLAQKIARTVGETIHRRDIAGSTGQAMRYGDVLVLVRQRGALFEAVIRALKDANVPVAGADRLVLTEHIAVIDMMALADAMLLPNDYLALAVALKSPLFGLDDEQLFRLAWQRRGSLRAALKAKVADEPAFAQAAARLDRCMRHAQRSPFDFFAWLLGPERGRGRFFARLGHEAADALDEFLELALDYERREPPSLQGFLAWLRAAETEIKRDMEISRDEVRVMTVHGAKGLEAPLVILADTTTPPTGARPPRLLALAPKKAAPDTPDRLVWAGRKDGDVAAVAAARQRALDEAENEYRRLLYVAMTRAADRLIVAGCEGARKSPDGCWYDLVSRGLADKPGFSTIGEGDERIGIYCKTPPEPAVVSAPAAVAAATVEHPTWLRRNAPPEAARAVTVTPSSALDPAVPGPAAPGVRGEPQRRALARGRLIHRLMQSLPDIPAERRGSAARLYLARSGGVFSAADHDRFIAETLAVMDERRFSPLFAAGSRAEVPIVGRIRRPGRSTLTVSGQIDRLVVTPDAVLIADYKTNRPVPDNVADVERGYGGYVAQLALYRAVLARLYPGRAVRAALVWTDGPDLMEISGEMLEQAVARLTSA